MNGHEALSGLTVQEQRKLLRELLERRASQDLGFPMSVQQQSLWYEYQRDPSWPGFNVFLPARIRSKIDVELFHRAIDQLVDRHASLRTTFGTRGGEPYQRVQPSLPAEFQVVDASKQSESELHDLVTSDSVRAFDLETGPPLRLTLFKRADDDWVVIATAHHIVVDFWSLVLLLREIGQLYESLVKGHDAMLPPTPNNYASFVEHQQSLLNLPSGDRLRRYWRKQLRDTAFITDFPTDFVRPPQFTGRGSVVPIEFPSDIVESMSSLAGELRVTFPALLLAIIQTLVHRYTGQASFLIGSPFSGRLQREYEETVGFFVNMLPLRADITADVTFTDIVKQAARSFAEALQHEALPLAEIIRDSAIPRDASRSPLFQVGCTFEKSHRKEEEGRAGYLLSSQTQRANVGGLEQESYSVPIQTCHYDLEFIFERHEGGLHAMLCYCRDLFDPSSMETLAKNLCDLAEQLLKHPTRPVSDVPWSGKQHVGIASPSRVEPAHHAMRFDDYRSDSAGSGSQQSPWIVPRIRQIAASDPHRTALAARDYQRTYRELVEESDRIACALAKRGIGPGSYVPVVGSRGPKVIPALIGVMVAGAAVVPIDAAEPAVSPADLLNDTNAKMVIVEETSQWSVPEEANGVEVSTLEQLLSEEVNPSHKPTSAAADDLCYVIYTSGSSGRPKGVMIEHQAIDNTMQWRSKTVPLATDDRVLILLSHQFDAGFGLMFSSLVQGARLVWPGTGASNVEAIIQLIDHEAITVLPTIPSLLSLFVDHPWFDRCKALRQVWTGGETMPNDLPARLRQRQPLSFWNFYGPTEAAIEATAAEVSQHPADRVVPIGDPILNTEMMVLDGELRRVPPTVPGELAICGRGLARGYLGLPSLTAQRFRTLRDGRRVFLTGDRGRERSDGTFEFLGRSDDQIKLGGYRIELQEIEHALRTSPLVTDAAVKVHRSESGSASLVAYVTSDRDSGLPRESVGDKVKTYIAGQLPPFKRPRQIVVLDSLPKTSSGKVDRNRLPELSEQQLSHRPYLAARTPLEQHLAGEWAAVLGIQQVGVNQDFFELGGSSLQAAMLAARLSEQLAVHVPTSLLFDMPDVMRTCERLTNLHGDALARRFGIESIAFYSDPAREREESTNDIPMHPLITVLDSRSGRLVEPTGPSAVAKSPIFMVHPPGGIVVCYRDLARLASDNTAVLRDSFTRPARG